MFKVPTHNTLRYTHTHPHLTKTTTSLHLELPHDKIKWRLVGASLRLTHSPIPCSQQSISKWEQQNKLAGKKMYMRDSKIRKQRAAGEITYGKVVALKLC